MASRVLLDASQVDALHTALRGLSDEVRDTVMSLLEDQAKAIASEARAKVPRRTGRAAASYQARGTAVTFGDGVPYVPWLEFGGAPGRRDSVRRPYVRQGRYVYPAIAAHRDEFDKLVDDLIEQATNGYLEVEGQ